MELRTEKQIQTAKVRKRIAEEFIDLLQKGAAKEAAHRILKKKYPKLKSYNTLYHINKEYQRNQVDLLSKAIGTEGLFESLDEIFKDFKKS
jgi:hypothetical protein